MLVKLVSSTAGELLMMAGTASVLFQIMGKEGTARGVFTFEQLPEALARLRAGAHAAPPPSAVDEDDADASAIPVGLAQRAFPLIELMQRTLQDEGYVMWEAAQPF